MVYASLHELLGRLPGRRLLVVGDVMLDRYVYGSAERISPEAPIPVLRIQREQAMPGGAGNVARNLAAMGGTVALVGVAGDDRAGRALRRLLGESGAVEPALVAEADRPTTEKTRFVAGGQQMMRADHEDPRPLAPETVAGLLAAVEAHLRGCDLMVLSDYAKGVLGDPVLRGVIARARAAGVPVVADPKSRDFARYAGVSLLKPNRQELAQAVPLAGDGDAAIAAAAERLLHPDDLPAILVTRGEAGISLMRSGQPAVHLKAEAREVFDVSGAGDSVLSALAMAMAAGADLVEAARLANLAGGVAVGRTGTTAVSLADLAHALHDRAVDASSAAKVVDLATAQARIGFWRSAGNRIGFTNGCFDLLHPGHVSLLSQARAGCDRLVVGLNSDASVRRLKGEHRPVQSEEARATVLASLAMVDLVVLFGADTPYELIAALRPDLLVKGADYQLDQVVGGDLVRSYGGEVLLARLEPGHSTTSTIGRIGRRAG
jgi:D-beta-D-heptose 7-phosphate kinase/D-beta-D-heptose 1-phosphate adenosyltransferase